MTTRPTSVSAVPPAPLDAGLVDQATLVAAGHLRAIELVALALERAEALQAVCHPFQLLLADRALDEARAADRRLAAGGRAPLLGVPVVVKDDTDIAGLPTAFGCPGEPPPASADAELVRRLRAAGAIVVAKTTTPELGQWPFTEGRAFGVTRNPWELGHTPGGSSGGTAAAVAAGVVAAGTGSDGAGSIRIPAAWCHLVGIKPPRGRVSVWPDAEAFHGLTTHGTLARSVHDAATLLDVVTGTVPGERHRLPDPTMPLAEAARRPPPPLRIGLCLEAPFTGFSAPVADEVRVATERIAGVLSGLGHHVVPVDPPWDLLGLAFLPRSMRALAEWERRVPDPRLLDPRTQANCRTGRLVPGAALRLADLVERRRGAAMLRLFDQVDLLVTPTTATPPLPIGATDGASGWRTDRTVVRACPFAWPWNVLGWPAVAVPAGISADGTPVGVQLLGPVRAETTAVSLAAQLQEVEGWHRTWPTAWCAGATPDPDPSGR